MLPIVFIPLIHSLWHLHRFEYQYYIGTKENEKFFYQDHKKLDDLLLQLRKNVVETDTIL